MRSKSKIWLIANLKIIVNLDATFHTRNVANKLKIMPIEKIENNIIGVYASFGFEEPNKEFVKELLWGENGIKNQFSSLKSQNYGTDIMLILFEFYVNPIPYLRGNLKEIGSYRKKEKSIGIPTILDNETFFNLNKNEQNLFLKNTILNKLTLVKEKVKRNKLNFRIDELIIDVEKLYGEKASWQHRV